MTGSLRFFDSRYKVAYVVLGLTLGLSSVNAHASKVVKVEGSKVMIELEGTAAKDDEMMFALDSSGKKKGLVKIKGVKGDKAIGILTKGKAEVGWKLEGAKKSASGAGAKSSGKVASKKRADKSGEGHSTAGRAFWGAIVGFGMDHMDVNVDNNADGVGDKVVALKGNGFSAKALFDYNLFSDFWFRGMGGLEGFAATGDSEVGCGNKACSVNIYYLAADFWARYLFTQSTMRWWAGVGFSVMFPASKNVTALESSSVTNTSVMSFGAGVDIFTSPTFFIPLQFEYGMLPKSETVKAGSMSLRVGFGIPF